MEFEASDLGITIDECRLTSEQQSQWNAGYEVSLYAHQCLGAIPSGVSSFVSSVNGVTPSWALVSLATLVLLRVFRII